MPEHASPAPSWQPARSLTGTFGPIEIAVPRARLTKPEVVVASVNRMVAVVPHSAAQIVLDNGRLEGLAP